MSISASDPQLPGYFQMPNRSSFLTYRTPFLLVSHSFLLDTAWTRPSFPNARTAKQTSISTLTTRTELLDWCSRFCSLSAPSYISHISYHIGLGTSCHSLWAALVRLLYQSPAFHPPNIKQRKQVATTVEPGHITTFDSVTRTFFNSS